MIPSTTDTENGSTIYIQCCVGPPMVNVDGTAYVEYEVRNITNGVITSDSLYLFRIDPDNSSSSTLLSSTTQDEIQFPGQIVPDGQGGVLATWTVYLPNQPVQQYPYQAVDVANGNIGSPYNLPFSPQSISLGDSPTIILGQNGTAFASGHSTVSNPDGSKTPVDQVVSFNISSGTPNWNYQGAQGALSLIQATADGGVTISDTDPGAIQIDANGNASTPVPMLQGATPMDLSSWISVAGGALSMIWNPNGANGIPTILAQSASPMPHGNTLGQGTTPFCQQKNVNCALAPESDGLDPNPQHVQNRQVVYWLFNLQNGTLNALLPSQNPPPVKIQEWEANASNGAGICSWQNPGSMCESPNTENKDTAGQLTDHMDAFLGGPFTVQQQFLVDRQGVQVFWPNSNGSWYGAWGTPQSSPPGFQPNQTANVVTGWATITQINANTNAPTACPKECDTMLPQAAQPKQ